jgi:hypothetical protein
MVKPGLASPVLMKRPNPLSGDAQGVHHTIANTLDSGVDLRFGHFQIGDVSVIECARIAPQRVVAAGANVFDDPPHDFFGAEVLAEGLSNACADRLRQRFWVHRE